MTRRYRRAVKYLLRAGFCNVANLIAAVLALIFVAQLAFRLSL